ncbi:interleukin 12Ba precursor [Scyliorhinus torazame]|uniref:interleukin 12Ba precursor n=1 Tax=Scyliorhinus torazame TaxID=75743 RepID=UPI003B58E64D
MVGRLFLCLCFLSLTVTVRMAFEEKYSIVNKTNQLVELNCEASSDQLWAGIHWRLDGVPLSKNAHSNKLNLEVTDRPDAGNYSCHMNSTGAIIKHYYILIDVERQTDKILKETNRKYITCQAERFGGTFTCFWTEREIAIFSASFHRDGWNGDTKDCVLTPCTSSECTVQATCTDQTFSPYAEELRQITITVEAATSKRYEKHTKHFYIRDILKPAAPKELTTTLRLHEVQVNWQYPDSWNSPRSYFPLLSQVSVELTSGKNRQRRRTRSKDASVESLIPGRATRKIHHRRKSHQSINYYTENSNLVFSVTKKQLQNIRRICVRVKELFFTSTWSEPSCKNYQTKGFLVNGSSNAGTDIKRDVLITT